MVFVGIFMMAFYYGSKARSVPDYLSLRFDEKTRGFNAITFAVMTSHSATGAPIFWWSNARWRPIRWHQPGGRH
jgi:uncharacterized sodium:solute symporter family permease YidK